MKKMSIRSLRFVTQVLISLSLSLNSRNCGWKETRYKEKKTNNRRTLHLKKMGKRLLHPGPIFALSIISFCFLTSIITIISWLPPNNLKNILNAALFHFWVANILKNFFKACFIGPGHVDFKWTPVSIFWYGFYIVLFLKNFKLPRRSQWSKRQKHAWKTTWPCRHAGQPGVNVQRKKKI